MDPENSRIRLVEQARRLLGVPYWNSGPSEMLDADLAVDPDELSCTGFIAVVFRRALGDGIARSFIRDALGMWRDLPGGLTTVPATLILPGDLAFFTREGHPAVDPLTGPGGLPQEWHVMLVSSPTTKVIGTCSLLKEVDEIDVARYVECKDDRGRCWTLEGHLRPPGVQHLRVAPVTSATLLALSVTPPPWSW